MCSKCGKTRDEQHQWKNGKCSVCGVTQPDKIQGLKNQSITETPKQQTAPPVVSQTDLAEIAKNDKNSDVRREAIKKIIDQDLLSAVAINACAENNNIGLDTIIAYKKTNDPSKLAEVARNAKDWSVRASCCKRLEDTDVLNDIAKNDVDEIVQRAAENKLRVISERKPVTHEPSFESLFFQVGLFARAETTGGLYDPNSFESMNICDTFVSYGKNSAQVMKSYLMTCAAGKEKYGWWTNASLIVECIPLAAGDSDADKLMLFSWLTQLVNVTSNIYEYDNNVRRYAQIELDALSI